MTRGHEHEQPITPQLVEQVQNKVDGLLEGSRKSPFAGLNPQTGEFVLSTQMPDSTYRTYVGPLDDLKPVENAKLTPLKDGGTHWISGTVAGKEVTLFVPMALGYYAPGSRTPQPPYFETPDGRVTLKQIPVNPPTR